MDLSQVKQRLLEMPHAVEEMPFGPGTLVYKVGGKMFALAPEEKPAEGSGHVNLKVEPPLGDMLRTTYPAITGAWHMNKRHWISIELDESVPDDEIESLIEDSWRLVVKGLTRAQRAELGIALP